MAEAYHGNKQGGIPKVKGSGPGTLGVPPPSEALLVMTQGATQTSSDGPCYGCGTLNQHKRNSKQAVSQQQCPLKNHPDWNAENIPFKDSVAGKRMAEMRIPFIKNDGTIPSSTSLSTHYRAMMDVGGQPIRIEPPIILQWPGNSSARGNYSGTSIPPYGTQIDKRARPSGPFNGPTGGPSRKKSHSYYQPIHACCMTCVTTNHIQACTTTCKQ